MFPWNFSQNGLVAYKNGELLEVQTIAKFLGEDNIKRIVNWVLKYFSELDIPVKVGHVQPLRGKSQRRNKRLTCIALLLL